MCAVSEMNKEKNEREEREEKREERTKEDKRGQKRERGERRRRGAREERKWKTHQHEINDTRNNATVNDGLNLRH